MDPTLVLLVGACAFATSMLTEVLGFGGGVVLLAVLVAFLDPLVALPLHAAIQVVSNGTRTLVRRHDVDWRIVWRTSLLLLPAGALSLSLARQAPDAVLQAAIAIAVLVATWLPEWLSRPLPAPSPGGWIAMGGVLGALNPVVGATGTLAAPFFRAGTKDRMGFVGTFAASQVAGHAAKLVIFGAVGLLPAAQAPAAAVGIVGVVAGTWVGSRVLDRMPERRFDRIYLVAITLVAAWLLVDALR
ncbi:sulfite exporter TauE/SafE family protein [Aeromicrobium choanae]|uniref:sulfite exporter TauE/SafE family protein n=1 Tax=Aeromicrobium choanae TaxID=1736691 RepID=UPI000999BC7F|nr:sulfite exporter TauE/SafE family protein [Aeromicrobium choanae]